MEKAVTETKKMLSDTFGGYSEIKSNGGYMLETGKLCQEKVSIIYSLSKDHKLSDIKKILLHAKHLKETLKQECILIEINNDFKFV